MKRVVVAIDGPAGAGKSTVARRLADKLGFLYLDTGAMYRAVALWALRANIDLNDMHRLEQLALSSDISFKDQGRRVFLNGEDVTEAIRQPRVSAAASQVSTIPGVRRALVQKQREMAEGVSVVMEGRDIGSVVFPAADVKVFLDAAPEIRAERRAKELQQRDGMANSEEVSSELRQRDERDRNRAEAPLVQAPDAVYIDSSKLSLDEVEEVLLRVVRERVSNGRELSR
ncbi:MAG: (d)CMP kinase [Bryobacteraceae bacterium]|nr:(d)CMP kinase [Bryobacteraceae bacterium]